MRLLIGDWRPLPLPRGRLRYYAMGRRCVWNKSVQYSCIGALSFFGDWGGEVPPIDGAGLSGQGRSHRYYPPNAKNFLLIGATKLKPSLIWIVSR